MFGTLLYAFGLLCVAEGLVYLLAPRMIEELLAAMKDLPIDRRRVVGALAVALGLVFLVAARAMG